MFTPPESFFLGPVEFRLYGLMIGIGAVCAVLLTAWRARQRGENGDAIFDGAFWVMLGGIIGARIWHIFTPPASMVDAGLTTAYYFEQPLRMFEIWNGGLGIPGGIIGGVLTLWLFSRYRGLNFVLWGDLAAPGLALAQAIGRWGNYFNQELYGAPSDLPWAIFIDAQHRISGYETIERYHPLFLYESIWNILNMAALLLIERRFGERMRPGDLMLAYLVIYPVGRFMLEFLRLDPANIGGINANQTVMGVTALVALGALIWRHWRNPQPVIE